MTKEEISAVIFWASVLIGVGFGFIAGGLTNWAVGLGTGILAFCASVYLISTGKDVQKEFQE